jgi:signal peptidase I
MDATATDAHVKHSADSGVKETIESILVAFILAFIFRAFVVEAFVIPTGSMAPTLLGAHLRFRCPDCGYRFDVNYPAKTINEEVVIPSTATGTWDAYCPNCGFKVPYENPDDPEDDATNPPAHYGDRILVLKYLYLFQEPKRWDVVVFKSPDAPPGAVDYDYSVNYIKRLVGKPGEAVMILDGDVYIAKSNANNIEEFDIQRKASYAQQSLWRIVYDNDFHPLGKPRQGGATWRQPWMQKDGTGWNLGDSLLTSRVFRFDNPMSAGKLTFDADVNSTQHALTDWVAYDTDAYPTRGGAPAPVPVSDLKLDVIYQRTAGEGPLLLKLTKQDDAFVAQVLPTGVRLLRLSRGSERQIGETIPIADKTKPMHIELANVDYRVSVRIDGKEVIASKPEDYRPDTRALLEAFRDRKQMPRATVEISAAQQQCALSHVSLWRDIYYINRNATRATPDRFPQNVVRLGPDEFFVLGDNSAISGDARFWDAPIDLGAEDLHVPKGRVPGRFLLGKAFFVYWPAGYRPLTNLPSIVPNFGDMRFIH